MPLCDFFWKLQHIYAPGKSDGIDGTIRVSVVILHDLQYAGALALPGLRRRVFTAKLGNAQGSTNTVFDRFGKR